MATNTPNYNLIKPAPEDFYNIADFNANSDIIDAELTKKPDLVTTSETVTVGNNGADYVTLNAAIEYFSKKYPVHDPAGKPNVVIELQAGWVMREQVLISNLDLSWMDIQSVDTVVNVDRSKLDNNAYIPDGGETAGIFVVNHGKPPKINTHFKLGSQTLKTGVTLTAGIVLHFAEAELYHPTKEVGFTGNFDYAYCAMNGSALRVERAKAQGQKSAFLTVNSSSLIANTPDVLSTPSGNVLMSNTNCLNSMRTFTFDNCGHPIVVIYIAHSSTFVGNNINIRNSENNGIMFQTNSSGYLSSCNFSNNRNGIIVQNGSTLHAYQCISSNCTEKGLYITNGSIANAYAHTSQDCRVNVGVHHASSLNFYQGQANRGTNTGILAEHSSQVEAYKATCKDCNNVGVSARLNSHINAREVNASSIHAGAIGFHIMEGSTITKNGASGNTNQAVNTLTRQGIIYD